MIGNQKNAGAKIIDRNQPKVDIVSPEQKKLKMNDLRQTLNSGEVQVDGNLLTFHEKVDNIIDE